MSSATPIQLETPKESAEPQIQVEVLYQEVEADVEAEASAKKADGKDDTPDTSDAEFDMINIDVKGLQQCEFKASIIKDSPQNP